MKLALTHKSYCRGILFHILYLFNYIVIVLEQAGILVSPRSQSARDPSQTKIPVSPRSQSTQDPSQPKIPVSPGCPHAYLAHAYLEHAYLVFGSCLFDIGSCQFDIWLMPIRFMAHSKLVSNKFSNTYLDFSHSDLAHAHFPSLKNA